MSADEKRSGTRAEPRRHSAEHSPEVPPSDQQRGVLWRGGGCTAIFAAARGESPASLAGSPARWLEARDAASGLDDLPPRLAAAARRFFEQGGARVALLADTSGGPDAEHPLLSSIGTSEEFGFASGVHALAEDERVGAVAVIDPLAPSALAALEVLALDRPDLLFLLESAADPEPAFVAENVVRVAGAASVAGRLAASEHPARRPVAAGASWARLHSLRTLQGIRRSIDWGTRWLLGELHHVSSWRRAEREVRAFLFRLGDEGVIDRRTPFEVRCSPCAPTQDERRRGRPLAAVRFEVAVTVTPGGSLRR